VLLESITRLNLYLKIIKFWFDGVDAVDLQVLLSAMYLKDYRYIDTLNITTDCIVINQCDDEGKMSILHNGRSIKFVSTKERGLSKSRNMAISLADADICILCDNDVEYLSDYEATILEEFEKHPEYDIIVFFIKRNKPSSKPYFKNKKRLGYLSTLKVLSPEIAFRRKSIVDNNIQFKTDFGAGAKYSMGEENIFLYDCLKRGLKILYVPKQIATLRDEESTWFKGYTEKYFIDRGAIFCEMSKRFSVILIIQFALRKRRLFKKQISVRKAIKLMLAGRSQYINEQRKPMMTKTCKN
jgi:glycosyltransferase involved in cell wall biosynthesis